MQGGDLLTDKRMRGFKAAAFKLRTEIINNEMDGINEFFRKFVYELSERRVANEVGHIQANEEQIRLMEAIYRLGDEQLDAFAADFHARLNGAETPKGAFAPEDRRLFKDSIYKLSEIIKQNSAMREKTVSETGGRLESLKKPELRGFLQNEDITGEIASIIDMSHFNFRRIENARDWLSAVLSGAADLYQVYDNADISPEDKLAVYGAAAFDHLFGKLSPDELEDLFARTTIDGKPLESLARELSAVSTGHTGDNVRESEDYTDYKKCLLASAYVGARKMGLDARKDISNG